MLLGYVQTIMSIIFDVTASVWNSVKKVLGPHAMNLKS